MSLAHNLFTSLATHGVLLQSPAPRVKRISTSAQICRFNSCKEKVCENMDRSFHTDSEIERQTNFLLNCRIFHENGWEQPEFWNRDQQIHLPAANWRLPAQRRHVSPDLVRIQFLVISPLFTGWSSWLQIERSRGGKRKNLQLYSTERYLVSEMSHSRSCGAFRPPPKMHTSSAVVGSGQECWYSAPHCRPP